MEWVRKKNASKNESVNKSPPEVYEIVYTKGAILSLTLNFDPPFNRNSLCISDISEMSLQNLIN